MKHTKKNLNRNKYLGKKYSHKNKKNFNKIISYHGGDLKTQIDKANKYIVEPIKSLGKGINSKTSFKNDSESVSKNLKSAAKDLGEESKKVLKDTGDFMKEYPGRWMDKYIVNPALYIGTLGTIYFLDKALTDYELGKLTLGDINSLGAIDCNETDAKKILDDAKSLRKQGKIFLSETNLQKMEEKNMINTRDRDILSRFDNKLREKINLKFFYTTQENTNDRSFIRPFLESLNAYVEKRDEMFMNEPNETTLEAKKLQQKDFKNIQLVIKHFFVEHLQKLLELNESDSGGIKDPVNLDKKVESSQTFEKLKNKYIKKVNELKEKVNNDNQIKSKIRKPYKETLENLYFKQKEFIDYFKTLVKKIGKYNNFKIDILNRENYLKNVEKLLELIDEAKVDFTKKKLIGFRSEEQKRGIGVDGTYTQKFKEKVKKFTPKELSESESFKTNVLENIEKIKEQFKEEIKEEKEKKINPKVMLATNADIETTHGNKDAYKNLLSAYLGTTNMSDKFIILSRLFTFIDDAMVAKYLGYYLFSQKTNNEDEIKKKLKDANYNNFNIKRRNWLLQSNSPFFKLNNIYGKNITTVNPQSLLRLNLQAYTDAAQELEVALDVVNERNNKIQQEINELDGKVSKVDLKTSLTKEKKDKQKIIIENLEKYKDELKEKLKDEKKKLDDEKKKLSLESELENMYNGWLQRNIKKLEFDKDNLNKQIDESEKSKLLPEFVKAKNKLSNLKDKSEKQIEEDKKKIKILDETLKKINEGVDNINKLFVEYKKYIKVKMLLNIDETKINTPINDKLIQEINEIFFPSKYGEKKSREALQKRDVDFFEALVRRFVYLRLSIIRYNINKIFEYKKQEDKKDQIDELITSNSYLLYFLVNEFVKILRMHPARDFLLTGTELNPNLDSLSFFQSIKYKPSVTIQEILKKFNFDHKSKYKEKASKSPEKTSVYPAIKGGATEDKYESLSKQEKKLVEIFFSFLYQISSVTKIKSYLDKSSKDRISIETFFTFFKANKLIDPILKGKKNYLITTVFGLKLLSSDDIRLQAKCRGLTDNKLNDCRKDYNKERLNKFIGKAGVLEHILRLYIGVHLKELDPSTNWSDYAQIGDTKVIRSASKDKSVSKALTKKTKKRGMELGQGIMRTQAALFSKITSMKSYPNLNADAVEVLKEFLNLYPDWNTAKASVTDDDYKRIQTGLDDYGFKKKSEIEVVKDFTFIEHFIFALCSKRGSFSGKMKYTSRNLEGSKKTNEVERSKERDEKRKKGSAYQKATRALKGETTEFEFTNSQALMNTAKVGGKALRESHGIGSAATGKVGDLGRNIADRTGCFFKRFVTINGKKEEICGEKRALTDKEVKALEKGEMDFNEFAGQSFTKGRKTSKAALEGVKNVGKYAANKQKILRRLGKEALEGKAEAPKEEYSEGQKQSILDGSIPTKRCFEKYIYEAMKAIDCKKIKSEEGKKNCKQTKKDKKTENKDSCSKKNFKTTLDELYCYKELYDKNGKEKFRGQVKFLCRRNHCVPQPDPICDELNVCKNLRPRIRDIPRESRYLFKEFKKMIQNTDPTARISKLGSYSGIKSGLKTGYSKFRGRMMSTGEFKKVFKEYEKHRKKSMKKNLKKQFNVFKKTPEGKQYMKYENAIKKSLDKTSRQTIEKESRKKVKPGQREKRLAKLEKDKELLKLNREKMKSYEKELCKEPADEKCILLKDAIKFRRFDTDTKLFKYAREKMGTKKKDKKK